MSDDFDLDFDDLDSTPAETPAPTRRRGPAPDAPRALIVEDEPLLARICSRAATRLGMRPLVVWTRDDALAALAAGPDAPAFVYADARIFGGAVAAASAELRALRPATPFVVGSRVLDDVLVADSVALCKPFDGDRFVEAFDSATTEEHARLRRLAAAADVRALEAKEAVAAEREAFDDVAPPRPDPLPLSA